MRVVLCAAPSYLARRGTPIRLADLGDHDCLGHTNASLAGTTSWAFGKDGTIKVPIAGSMCSDNGEALVRAAIAGQGLVYGPRFIAAEALRAGQLSELELDEPPMMLGAAYAITHPTRRPAAKTRAWIDFLAEALPRSWHRLVRCRASRLPKFSPEDRVCYLETSRSFTIVDISDPAKATPTTAHGWHRLRRDLVPFSWCSGAAGATDVE